MISITLSKLLLKTHIGISLSERTEMQYIYCDIKIFLSRNDIFNMEDNIESTICYQNLAKLTTDFALNHTYQLIEIFGRELFKLISQYLINNYNKKNIILNLQLRKKPIIDNLLGGAIFSMKDEIKFWIK